MWLHFYIISTVSLKIPNAWKKQPVLFTVRFSFKAKLTRFSPIFHFYSPLKTSENLCFLTFSGGIEMKNWEGSVGDDTLI